MASKIFSRLRTSGRRTKAQSTVPAYSVIDSMSDTTTPPYEERRPDSAQNFDQQRPELVRTTSNSSYTSMELSSWVDLGEAAQEKHDEDLPRYEETEQDLKVVWNSQSSLSLVSSSSQRRPHAMCPCADCHRMR